MENEIVSRSQEWQLKLACYTSNDARTQFMVLDSHIVFTGDIVCKLQFQPGDHNIRGMREPSVETAPSVFDDIIQCHLTVAK